MENADLPVENAAEPYDEARQPSIGNMENKPVQPRNKMDINDVMSQPAPSSSHRERLLWLQKRRQTGLWVQCDECNSWRHLPHVLDRHELPNKWFCNMNAEALPLGCAMPEAALVVREEEDLIHSEYSAGSVVWARVPGWPWWPAMVDDCPDVEQFYWLDGFSDIPTHYNVVFFDNANVTRSWIAPSLMKPYGLGRKTLENPNTKIYKKRIEVAMAQANDACNLPLAERLAKYSFINRYKGPIGEPKIINTKDIRKNQNKLKRKYNVEFPVENSDDDSPRATEGRNNIIILGSTPKSNKGKAVKLNQKRLRMDETDSNHTMIEQSTSSKTYLRNNLTNSEDIYKHPNSMAVNFEATLKSITNERYNAGEFGSTPTQGLIQDIQGRMSPRSDDFDF